MNSSWIDQIVSNPDLMWMGHGQSVPDRNLGMGWLYYALARMYRPRHVVCIGSWRGFAPMMFARGLLDNLDDGRVTFIDPSMADDQWSDPESVCAWFMEYSVPNIDHYCMTTEQFVTSDAYKQMNPVDFVFVDGYHTEERAKFDHQAFEPKLVKNGLALFHDSVNQRVSKMYGEDKAYQYSVCRYIDQLKTRRDLQILDLPLENGLTLVRHCDL
jgi:predicted O-methyltransferase YrrM